MRASPIRNTARKVIYFLRRYLLTIILNERFDYKPKLIVSIGALSTSNYYPDSLESSFSKSKYSPLLMFCLVSKGQSKRKPHPHGQSFPVADLISGCFTSQPQSLAFIIGHSQYLAQSLRVHLKPFIRVLVRSGQFSKPCTSEAVFNKKV